MVGCVLNQLKSSAFSTAIWPHPIHNVHFQAPAMCKTNKVSIAVSHSDNSTS